MYRYLAALIWTALILLLKWVEWISAHAAIFLLSADMDK